MESVRVSSLRHMGKAALCGTAASAIAVATGIAGVRLVTESDSAASLYLSLLAVVAGTGLPLFTFLCSSAIALRLARVRPLSSVLPTGCLLCVLYTYAAMNVLRLSADQGLFLAAVTPGAGLAAAVMITDPRWALRWRLAAGALSGLALPLGMAADRVGDMNPL